MLNRRPPRTVVLINAPEGALNQHAINREHLEARALCRASVRVRASDDELGVVFIRARCFLRDLNPGKWRSVTNRSCITAPTICTGPRTRGWHIQSALTFSVSWGYSRQIMSRISLLFSVSDCVVPRDSRLKNGQRGPRCVLGFRSFFDCATIS